MSAEQSAPTATPATPRARPVPPIYRAIILEVERRRLARGISMDRMSELMGTAERSYAKMLYPETSSGRMVQWGTLQAAMDVLFADGYELRINELKGMLGTSSMIPSGVNTTEGTRRKIKMEAATWDRRIRREVMSDLGKMGGPARAAKLSPGRRLKIARKAAKARWDRARANVQGSVDAVQADAAI